MTGTIPMILNKLFIREFSMVTQMEQRYTFRTATNDDTPGIIKLVRKCLAEFNFDYSESSSENDLFDIEACYLLSGGSFEVIEEEGGDIVGTIGLIAIDNSTAKLRKMYVDPAHRQIGLGKTLLSRAISKSCDIGCERILLETVDVMRQAVQLYESFGFVKVAMKATSPRCNLVMVKVLCH